MITASLLVLAALQARPITEKDAADFGRALEKAVAKDGAGVCCKMIDLDAFFARVKGKTELSAPMNQLLRSMMDLPCSAPAVFSISGTDMAMNFLRVKTVGQEFRPVMRIVGQNGKLSYHELILGGDSTGITVVDFWILNFGECHSDVVRRIYFPDERDLKLLNKFRGPTAGDLVEGFERKPITRFMKISREGTPREALDYFDRSESLKRVSTAHVMRLSSALKIDAATFESALGDMRVAFPEEPAAHLAAMNGYLTLKKFDKALAAIDKIDAYVGGDTYLNVQRVGVHIAAANLPKALEVATALVRADSGSESSWWALVGVHLEMKDFKAVVADFGDIEKRLKISVPDPVGDPRYAEFIKSPEYAEWRKARH